MCGVVYAVTMSYVLVMLTAVGSDNSRQRYVHTCTFSHVYFVVDQV